MGFFERINDRLRHETTSGAQFKELDAFRGWACLLVLVGHILSFSVDEGYIYISSRFYRFGGPGVFLFFFISGFLLYMKWGRTYYFDRPTPPKGRYFKRRLLRIAPAYLANLTIIVALYGLVFFNPIFSNNGIGDILQHVFFLHNVSVANYSSINAVAWTLPIEMQFYIILPFIASWFYGRRSLVSVPVTIILSMAYCISSYYLLKSFGEMDYKLTRAVSEQLPTMLFMFVVGICFSNMWLYVMTEKGRSTLMGSSRFGNTLLFLGLGVLLLLWYIRPQGVFLWGYLWILPYIIACGMVVFGTLQSSLKLVRAVIANPVVEFFGIISYSLYLWHWPILMNMNYWLPTHELSKGAKFAVVALATVIISIAVSVISYMVFEKPFLKVRSSKLGAVA